MNDPDVQLMLRVQGGDDDAFTELVSAYQDRLINIFCHLLQDQEAAEDLAQDVFLRIYRNRQNYKPIAKFSTWMFRIANNLASNVRRSKRRRKEVSWNLQGSGALNAKPGEKLLAAKSGFLPTRRLDKVEMRDAVHMALESLNERQRMAILLHKFEGMTYADIAQAMELTPSAVKSVLSRARENLRIKLEPYVKGSSSWAKLTS